jgi:hypothetical protein
MSSPSSYDMKKSVYVYTAVILVALIGMITGCDRSSHNDHKSPPSIEVPLGEVMVMSGVDFKVCLITNGIRSYDCFYVDREQFAVPDVAWVERELPKLALAAQKHFGLVQTPEIMNQPDDRDCDEYAKLTSMWAKLTYVQQRVKRGAALAIGDYSYEPYPHMPGYKHMINVIIARRGVSDYVPMFYDPMLLKFVVVDKKLKDTCGYYQF